MTSPLAFLPLALPAASLGLAAAQQVTRGMLAAGGSFASALTAGMDSSPESETLAGKPSAPSLSELLDQLRTRLASKLQSLGLSAEDFTLQLDEAGEVLVDGNSDSATLAEQLLQSDEELQRFVTRLAQKQTSVAA